MRSQFGFLLVGEQLTAIDANAPEGTNLVTQAGVTAIAFVVIAKDLASDVALDSVHFKDLAMSRFVRSSVALAALSLLAACADSSTAPIAANASAVMSGSSGGGGGGGGGGGTVQVDQIKVSKCYWNSGGQMLIKASSSDASATLTAYRPDGTVIGWVQNGGGSRYGGTVMPYTPIDPVMVTIRSSSGGSITVPTGPFQI